MTSYKRRNPDTRTCTLPPSLSLTHAGPEKNGPGPASRATAGRDSAVTNVGGSWAAPLPITRQPHRGRTARRPLPHARGGAAWPSRGRRTTAPESSRHTGRRLRSTWLVCTGSAGPGVVAPTPQVPLWPRTSTGSRSQPSPGAFLLRRGGAATPTRDQVAWGLVGGWEGQSPAHPDPHPGSFTP